MAIRKVVTLPWETAEYPINKLHGYKYVFPLDKREVDGVWYHTFQVTLYSGEEYAENKVYGDRQHEEYLCSEQHESDVKSEQWDWLKNEIG